MGKSGAGGKEKIETMSKAIIEVTDISEEDIQTPNSC